MQDPVLKTEENKTTARRYIEELQNAKNLEIIDELMIEDCIIHLGSRYVDRGKYKKMAESNYKVFPDLHIEIEHQIAEGEMVSTQWKSRFTHTNKFMDYEPTFEEILIAGISIHRIIGGRIVEVWIYWDRLELIQQLSITKPV